MITAEKLPDGSTLYTYSGVGIIRPFVFEGSDFSELVDFTLQHLKEDIKRHADTWAEEQACES